ncbi:GMC family oxidoreductase [Rhodanobacter denitrificans]|uniref:Choline dehydrogenase-like flavoprotein n=1 Tax=Rhodanobacter denitrificans TaxID=666685 RepID=M4NAZ7_9GAMM|nr:choline dehydrogenase [Rhodanobacter denitrificans]AGG87770.1 choline dehydrogenase-like flavoprotein [Rhodanobacter denitrificans]UJM86936.1 choline dehydrogenase [Rhodanobacter denitrificans]
MNHYDYIIVGAGSAGCVLAHRLSADPATRVLLLEAGPADWNPLIHMPAGIARLANNRALNWNYRTEPEPALGQRRLWWPRGKTLGGSSSINAMCYIRGVAADYDGWAEASGDPRWSWREVLPWFLRSEDNSRGAGALHGAGGPLGVADLRHRNVLSEALLDAAASAGFARNDDFNGERQAGFGLYQVTQRDGARCSSATAFLKPVRRRANLDVRTHALVERVLIEHRRAVGVQLRRGRHDAERIAAGEVILAGGAINSPQLLMLSGLGPADHLREHGIAVLADLPDVGAHLQDHLDICTLDGNPSRVSYDHLNELAAGWRWLRHRDGPGSSNVAEAGGFVRSRHAADARCDLQFHFVPALLDDHGRHRLPGYGYTLHACHLHPRSRGRLRLHSADPAQPIAIHANYLGDPEGHDLKMMIEAARLSREILDQAAFAPYRGAPVFPERRIASDAEYVDFIRRKAETIYHPVGTCRMGKDDRAVVDSELRVRGVDGLRVVDASVMPTLPTGNTNAPTIMIAERASALIAGGNGGSQVAT